jgi:hypothetical protein
LEKKTEKFCACLLIIAIVNERIHKTERASNAVGGKTLHAEGGKTEGREFLCMYSEKK